jgi:biofilm PGA synthesis N-glycosyltransferase PgaC
MCAMQILEAASIIGLIRRTQSLSGRVATVAGVIGLFHRERVLAVGGYDGRMATEDIDLTWRLLLAGWQTGYEPAALVGMEVPSTLSALWAQRKRWARGQGEVLHQHAGAVCRWRHRRMWLVAVESIASLLWINLLALTLLLVAIRLTVGVELEVFGSGLGWGIAISVIATLQLSVALALERSYDRWMLRAFLFGPLYPLLYWLVSGLASLRSQGAALLTGPREQRVVWDIPREQLTTD